MNKLLSWSLLFVGVLAASQATAQTTGSIHGVARDGAGAPLAGVVVSIAGPQMPLGRSATTTTDGVFRFLNLVPGPYVLRAEFQGLTTYKQDVVVNLSKVTEVWPVLQAAAAEEVNVVATPLVDTKATDVSQVTTRDTIENLPLARTFSGTFQLAPGVADSAVAVSNTNVGVNAAGGRQDNVFLYDGVNVTNPFYGDLYQDFAELDIQEVNITRAGILPEYGRTGGFVVNGVTKSGTNALHGEARLDLTPSGFESDAKGGRVQDQVSRFRPGLGLGGPLWKDHLFGYGSANFFFEDQKERSNLTGPLPDSNFDIREYFGKLTATPTPSHLVNASLRYRRVTEDNTNIDFDSTPSTGATTKETSRVGVLSWFWTVTPSASLDFKFLLNDQPGSSAPNVGISYQPPFDPADPSNVGYFCGLDGLCRGVNSVRNGIENHRRLEYKLTGSYATHFLGASHLLKAGGTYSDNRREVIRLANGWGSIGITGSRDLSRPGSVLPRAVHPGPAGPDFARPDHRAVRAGSGDLEPAHPEPRGSAQPGQVHSQR